jgi:hypothetical protein
MTEPVQYSDRLDVRIAPDLRLAIQASAAKRGQKPAEWLRNALWTVVALEGIGGAPDIRADGKRRYARVEGGAIVDVVYSEPAP